MGNLIGMPYPYTVPAVGYCDEINYFDTFFTNQGLAISGRWDLAKSNTDNMLYLVEKYGFMLNGNRTCFLVNSHPPSLSEVVRKVFDEISSLWEKYNVVEGNINVTRRATMPSMMGRIVGSYLALKKYYE